MDNVLLGDGKKPSGKQKRKKRAVKEATVKVPTDVEMEWKDDDESLPKRISKVPGGMCRLVPS